MQGPRPPANGLKGTSRLLILWPVCCQLYRCHSFAQDVSTIDLGKGFLFIAKWFLDFNTGLGAVVDPVGHEGSTWRCTWRVPRGRNWRMSAAWGGCQGAWASASEGRVFTDSWSVPVKDESVQQGWTGGAWRQEFLLREARLHRGTQNTIKQSQKGNSFVWHH